MERSRKNSPEVNFTRGSRASTPEQAREYRQAGHNEEDLLVLLYDWKKPNNHIGKTDLIDESNNHYSVKKGSAKHWQVFLYKLSRLKNDTSLKNIKIDNLGNFSELIVRGLKSFPQDFANYNGEIKHLGKLNFATVIEKILVLFNKKENIYKFLDFAFFNSGEVDYLVISEEVENTKNFLKFERVEFLTYFTENFIVEGSTGRRQGEYDNQKVLFKHKSIKDNKLVNFIELEYRNDSKVHYRELRCNAKASSQFVPTMKNNLAFDVI